MMAREFTETQFIRYIQRYLRQLAFFDENMPQVPVDGFFDSDTEHAVAYFQEKNGIPVTGIVDRPTWDALYAAYLLSVATNAKPESVDVFYRRPVPNALRLGDIGFAVTAVQYMLNEILTFYGDRQDVATDGLFGEGTLDAVREFQKYASLPETGEVDLETWNRITQTYNELFRNGNQ